MILSFEQNFSKPGKVDPNFKTNIADFSIISPKFETVWRVLILSIDP